MGKPCVHGAITDPASMFDASGSSSSRPVDQARDTAPSGDAEAQFGLGVFLASGPEPREYARALSLYQQAADQNHLLAQFNLAQMYALGHGTVQNDSLAVMWLQRAAQGGDAGAQYNLARRALRSSLHGAEVEAPEQRIEACKWFMLAAAQQYRDAEQLSDTSTLRMSMDEVTEARRRASEFPAA